MRKKEGRRNFPAPFRKDFMEEQEILKLLLQVQKGDLSPEQAMEDIRMEPELLVGNYADIDLHRSIRQGMPEVVYGEGKTAEQIAGILEAMIERELTNVMVTRLDAGKADEVREKLPGLEFRYEESARIGIANPRENEKIGKVVVVSAGTSDMPVAEEAALTAELYGSRVERVYDVGVAGLHRLLRRLPVFQEANVIIAIAGMEGALVSVVGGLVSCPVIGVPTSVGYGANFQGLAALLSMLNSCASGVSVVNIDNGFGAGVLAARINRQSCGIKDEIGEQSDETL